MAINDTSILVSIDDVAQWIEDDLNLRSITLYNDGDITDKVVFEIKAINQDYDHSTTTEDELTNQVIYTPGVLSKVDFDITPNKNYSSYTDVYSLELYGYYSELESVKTIYDSYIIEQKNNPFKTYNNWLITRFADGIDYAAPIDPEDGTGEERFLSASSFVYKYLDGGIHEANTTLYINDTLIPINDISWQGAQEAKSGKYSDSDSIQGHPISTSLSIKLNIPVLFTNPVIVEMLKDLRKNRLGNKYTVRFVDSLSDDTYEMFVTNHSSTLRENDIETYECTLNLYREVG